MKRYLKNKDFIPKSFIEEKNKDLKEKEKKIIYFLLILSLILLPIAIMDRVDKKEDKIEDTGISSTKNTDIDLDLWIYVIKKYKAEGEFNPYEAYIYLEGKEYLDEIFYDEKININSMEDLGENKYRLQISKR
ncbi:hypothetical protein [uncultured Clostridium sp.]|uniref:hypothetical protein n=1 Tax=uncultured Clostridium sp. TaxID=59620 RepID=UPI0025DE18CA|nr:hypothetical protein [uncultured Clostridium sp.]